MSSFPRWWKRFGQDLGAVTILMAVALSLGVFARTERAHPAGGIPPHSVLSLAEFRARVEEGTSPILDARTRTAYDQGHVPGALSFPADRFDDTYAQLRDRLKPGREGLVIVYCSNLWCGLAEEVQTKLVARGFRHVGRFEDGWEAWQKAGLPVEKAP